MHRGVDMGPSAVRVAGLVPLLESMGFTVVDTGNVACSTMAAAVEGNARARYLDYVVQDSELLAITVE